MDVILGTLLSLFVRLLGVEIGARHMPLCRWLVKVAAARLPDDERAGAESEWLAVIEDLRSPTAQLLHAGSYVWSAFRVRQAIAPEKRISTLGKAIMATQLFVVGLAGGGAADALFEHGNQVAGILSEHFAISKSIALVGVYVLGVMTGAIAYVNHRLLMWCFNRQAQRRASTLVE